MKRLAKIKEFLGDAKTKEDVKRKVALDCMKSEYLGVGKKDHVSFKFSLEKEMIEQLIFPYQHETSNRFSDFTFSVSPKMNFDDLDNYEEFARCDYEEFSYKPIAIPGIFLQPAVEIREERTGGEEEYYISG